MSTPSGFSWRRLRALCIKESKQIVRDPSSALIAIVIPLILLFIFGYGINLDSSKLRLGILVNQQSEPARELINAFTGSPFIDATLSDNRRELIDKLGRGISAVLWCSRRIWTNVWPVRAISHRFR